MSTAAIDARNGRGVRWAGDDFPGWLSPMLVKELRQGVQSGVFFWTFLLFQAALFLLFSLQVLASGREDDDGFRVLFWLAAFAAVAVIVPLRGIGAVSGEQRANGLDLLQITRLSATRIVAGKWVALVAQAALVAVTLLPYIALRYFFGRVDVLADLQWLGWILALGALVAAAAIALSTLPIWLRIGAGLAASGAAFVLLAAFVDGPLGIILARLGAAARLGIAAVLAVHTLACLEFAAARVAPPAENHAGRQRLLALLVAAAWPVAGWLGTDQAAVATFVATAPLLACYAIDATLERPSRVRTLFAPFRRAGLLGRVAATVFTPGWATGLVFVAILLAVCLAGWLGFVGRFVPAGWRSVAVACASLAAAAIVCPLPFTTLLTRVRYPLLLYGLVQLLCFCAFAFANGFKPYRLSWAEYEAGRLVTLPFPAGALAALAAIAGASQTAGQRVATSFTIAGLAVIGATVAAVAWPWLRERAAVARLVRGDHRDEPLPVRVAAAPRAVAAASRPWVWRGNDFPGWLPAMVVRELRQGVQSGVFAWTFIGIQGAMFALLTWALSSYDGRLQGVAARDVGGMFWLMIAAAIGGVVPLRGLVAISGERLGNNLDLVRLTRLSATRIVLGKWLALIGQGLLVATALAPYLVLRYFFGGLDIIVDLEVFGWLIALAMAVAAAALAISTLPLWLRIGVVVAVVAVGCVPAAELAEEFFNGRLSFAGLGIGGRLGILAGLGLYTVALLEFAAGRIASPAENHAGRKRLLALAIAVTWVVVATFGTQDAAIGTILVTLPLVLCYAVGALVEDPAEIRSLYRPFARFGTAGRWAAALFSPGWATGVPFVAVTGAVCLTGWMVWASRRQGYVASVGGTVDVMSIALTIGCLLIAACFFPLPFLIRLPQTRPRLLFYSLVHVACFLVFVYTAAVGPHNVAYRDRGLWMITLPFPAAALPAFISLADNRGPNYCLPFLAAAAITTAIVLASVAAPWRRAMRTTMGLVASDRPLTSER
jgi:hypothetical protein